MVSELITNQILKLFLEIKYLLLHIFISQVK